MALNLEAEIMFCEFSNLKASLNYSIRTSQWDTGLENIGAERKWNWLFKQTLHLRH